MTTASEEQLSNLLKKLYQHSLEAIFFFDSDGKLISANAAAQQIIEPDVYRKIVEGEAKAMCLTCRGYMSEDEQMTCVSCFMANRTENISSFQLYLETKGKGIVPYSASFQQIDPEQKTVVLMLRDLTRQWRTQTTLNERLRVKQVIKAQEDERKRISRELHDSVAQEVLSSLVDLRILKYMNIEGDVLEKVRQTEGALMRLLDEIRHLSVELRPATLDDLGLEAAFRTHFKWLEKNYGLSVHFTSNLDAKRYEGEIETVVYRIGQEAVLNALKYAEVEDVFVTLAEEGGCLQLNVQDEGIGFDVNEFLPKGTGLGLFGMRERIELVEGELNISSNQGQGTDIQARIPLKKERKASENHHR